MICWTLYFGISISLDSIKKAPATLPQFHPIRVVEQGYYHVIVYHVYSGVQHPMISMLFIQWRISKYPYIMTLKM